MPLSDPLSLLRCAEQAARAAGDHALVQRHRRHEIHQSFQHDVKLKLDLECQERAEGTILNGFPDHEILGEESADQTVANEAPLWIIDPIDGTINFYNGLPYWCSSVAVRHEGRVLAGAVYLPALNECYTATVDGPALCNGEPIRVRPCSGVDEAFILTGLTKDFEQDQDTMDTFNRLSRNSMKTRIQGAAAADLCQLACGRADIFYEACLYLWDVAAAGLIAERAGARCLQYDETASHRLRYLCTAPELFDEVVELLGIDDSA